MIKSREAVLPALLSLMSLSCGRPHPDGSMDCKALVLAPTSGSNSALGREIERAVAVSRSRSVRDRAALEFEIVDTQGNPSVARAAVLGISDKRGYPLIIGSLLSSETREFLPDALRAGKTVLATGSSDPGIRTMPGRVDGDRFFRVWPPDDFEGLVMAEYLRLSRHISRLAILHAEDAYARALADAFERRFVELGGVTAMRRAYAVDLPRFSALVAQAAGSGVDGLYVVGFPRDLASIYDALRGESSSRTLPLFSAVAIDTEDFRRLAKSELDNLIYTAPRLDVAGQAFDQLRSDYARLFDGSQPDIVSAVAIDALTLAERAFSEKGCSAQGMAEYLRSMPILEGAAGPVGFDKRGDVVTKAISIYYYDHGRRLLSESRSPAKGGGD